jgi:hypothetical protein
MSVYQLGPCIDLMEVETTESIGGGSTTLEWEAESSVKGTLTINIGPSSICGTASGGVSFILTSNGCGLLKIEGEGETSRAGLFPEGTVDLLSLPGRTSFKRITTLSKAAAACPDGDCRVWCDAKDDAVSSEEMPLFVPVICGQRLRIQVSAAAGRPGKDFAWSFTVEVVASETA